MFYMSDGGGGTGSTAAQPSYHGKPQTLKIEPEAVDAALKLFDEANNKVLVKINELRGAQAVVWSHDPVSEETAMKFNERSFGGDANSAMAALTGYQKQLQRAVDALTAVKQTYQNQDESARSGFSA